MTVFLNVDLGEMPDEPEALYASAHVANIACGGHAGDEASIRRAVERCHAHGVRVGAHPSYPDREGFGRRKISIGARELFASVQAQCARLASVPGAEGVAFAKLHGALYHDADRDDAIATGVLEAIRQALGPRIVVIGPADGALARAADGAALGYAREAFADRAVRTDGSLVPRGQAGALVVDPAAAASRARQLASRRDVDTVCVHGDTPGAPAIAAAVRAALDAADHEPLAGTDR